jgi:hypothetical protein
MLAGKLRRRQAFHRTAMRHGAAICGQALEYRRQWRD